MRARALAGREKQDRRAAETDRVDPMSQRPAVQIHNRVIGADRTPQRSTPAHAAKGTPPAARSLWRGPPPCPASSPVAAPCVPPCLAPPAVHRLRFVRLPVSAPPGCPPPPRYPTTCREQKIGGSSRASYHRRGTARAGYRGAERSGTSGRRRALRSGPGSHTPDSFAPSTSTAHPDSIAERL